MGNEKGNWKIVNKEFYGQIKQLSELLQEEIERYIYREKERAQTRGKTFSMNYLMNNLANKLGLNDQRQLYRYMSGEASLPGDKIILFCQATGSDALLEYLAYKLDRYCLENLPDPDELDGQDMIEEQLRAIREFHEGMTAIVDAINTHDRDPQYLDRMRKEIREAVRALMHVRDLVDKAYRNSMV